MDSDLIVLPGAAVEELLRGISRYQSPALRQRADDLLAAAKPVVDAGVYRVLRRGPFVIRIPVERAGDHRVLLIAADAAEEGE